MSTEDSNGTTHNRRQFLAYFTSLGLTSTLLPGVLWSQIQKRDDQKVTKEMLKAAEQIAGLKFTDSQRDEIIEGVNRNLHLYSELREVHLDVTVIPALHFNPVIPGMKFNMKRLKFRTSTPPKLVLPSDLESLAFWPITHLAHLIKTKKLRSVELTEMYIARLKKYDPVLKCVITLTEELALKQAKAADGEMASGHYRGPLHGIPWGVKDLFSTKGYRTTWGAKPFKDQIIDIDATVVDRLEKAGAVLVAKLSTGELAHDDIWFGGKTMNPWNTNEGSGGSSAGPASATAAGLVGFAIGTETGGSLITPAIRCGVTALRPTFGRVSRYGVMPVAWSFDKVGPICRSVEDCALVFNAIHGPDDMDPTVADFPFNWDAKGDYKKLRVGYLKSCFDEEWHIREEKINCQETLEKLKSLGVALVPIELPNLPIKSTLLISWFGEIGAVWDNMIRTGQDAELVRQDSDHIGALCRMTRTVPAVEYVQACRARTLVMEGIAKMMADIDVYIAPYSRNEPSPPVSELNLQLTNGTGHPAVIVPNGFTNDGLPTGITFIGKLYAEAETLRLASVYQNATTFHRKHPQL